MMRLMAEESSRPDPGVRRLGIVAVALAVAVFVAYGAHAAVLLLYPWDWSPDDGLALDYARRLVEDPVTLYPPDSSVPFPAVWGPLLPVVLAPAVRLPGSPLLLARLIAVLWTVAVSAAVYAAVRRRAPAPLALAASALSLAPQGMTFWYMLLRVDGLMVALWAWSAVTLLPTRLAAGGGRLSWPRAVAGAALLVAAALSKPTAIVHGAPLVLAWFFVDRASAVRLVGALAGLGGAALVALEMATGGGFLFAQRFWATHAIRPAQLVLILLLFGREAAGLLAVCAASAALALRQGRAAALDAALPMALGGLLAVPALAKYGAWHNYLLPLVCAFAVLTGRWLAAWAGAHGGARRPPAAALALAGTAAVIAVSSTFPLPARGDEERGRAFYDTVRGIGAPILAFRPEYAYYVVGQPTEVEGSGFRYLLAAGVPGTDLILQRIAERHYHAIMYFPGLWSLPPAVLELMHQHYVLHRQFELGYFYGRTPCVILVPRSRNGTP